MKSHFISHFHNNASPLWKRLPLFMKIFSFYFFLMGIILIGLILVQFVSHQEFHFPLSIYQLTATFTHSVMGKLIVGIYLLKALIAYGFYKGAHWTLPVAFFDGLSGIILWIFILFQPFFIGKNLIPYGLPIDLLFLIPYVAFSIRNSPRIERSAQD